MKLGRNMRARPKKTNDGRSNGQSSDKLDCAVTDPLLPLTANSSTSAAVEFFCHMHSRMPDLGTSNISYLTNNSFSLSRTIASPQHPTQELIENLNKQKQTPRQLEVEKEHHQAETKRWKTEDSLHRINSPSDQKELTSTETQSGLIKSKNMGYIHDRGVITRKENDKDDDSVHEKSDSSKEESDINDF
ncbi:hypothetical protein ACJMK2_020576 [Sinanodonta woodiana]|uniref:Uncharacterized protein n=1 Tax=Sinanodonta woodiana TaxID=1069815 RepID=A0ABD3TZP2_SINWO